MIGLRVVTFSRTVNWLFKKTGILLGCFLVVLVINYLP
jgi:hypothetical protein